MGNIVPGMNFGKLLLFTILIFLMGCRSKTLFEVVDPSYSGIHFNNRIIENDSINPLDLPNIYNGGGVGIADFNNDGLLDIYFTGNQVPNKLYLNKSNFHFQDVTELAGADGDMRWSRGVATVDINNDGWMDIYVSCTILGDPAKRRNLLYINKGTGDNGIPRFSEMAEEYGLSDTTHSTMAAFFDYDNDGDLDMYLAVNVILHGENPNLFRHAFTRGEHQSTGRLYRNEWNDQLKHPFFTDVSKEAGITIEGYSHGVSISDINKDGWKDIYVTNDFMPNNVLFINNGDGTFTNKVNQYFKHTSINSMGQDIIDINNDGLMDVIELDMNPEDNYRKKTMTNGSNYRVYQNFDAYGYQYQYVRNVLQLNQGVRMGQQDSIGDPIFSDIAFYAGIAETDWSWAPVVTDFDNDGFRDIIITNGYPKDVTDHDFIAFRNNASQLASKKLLLDQMPEEKLHNYGYHNNGNLTFTDQSISWGLTDPTFSNGAAYADLDNDGDMDLVINNINDSALIYKNSARDNGGGANNYLTLKLDGDTKNINGIGAWIDLYYGKDHQVYEQTPYRGYLSTIQLNPHFGLGTVSEIDSLIVRWPQGRCQRIQHVSVNQTLRINIKNALESYTWAIPDKPEHSFITEITDSARIDYQHQEADFIDFNVQKLLPHKFSEFGPGISAGDVDGNGLDDLIIGGAISYSPQILFQQNNGSFIKKNLLEGLKPNQKNWEERGMLLFDADGDGDLDLYTASGGYENKRNTDSYQDKLFINNGHGDFKVDTTALPKNTASKSCVRAADFDKDGDLDLFVAGRVDPGNYPAPVSGYIYRNDSKDGIPKFTDVSDIAAPSLIKIGMICDAIWTDMDNDGWQDLLIAGEWMPITVLKNEKGIFRNITPLSGISDVSGWWNSMVNGDFDNDGDIDYIVANLGENSFYKASKEFPISIYGKDFDNNGVIECIPTKYMKDRKGVLQEFTAHTRDDVVDQMPFIRKRFPTYKSFAEVTFEKLFTREEMKGAIKLHANYLSSIYLENQGSGKFTMHPLPPTAQLSPINAMISEDINGDGNLDVILSGNDYGTDLISGRYDAFNGLVLLGNGQGEFVALSIRESGFFLPANAKAMVTFINNKGERLIAASHNKGQVKIFRFQSNAREIPVSGDDEVAIFSLANGKVHRQELNYGASFLSQSCRSLRILTGAKYVSIINSKGKIRKIDLVQ